MNDFPSRIADKRKLIDSRLESYFTNGDEYTRDLYNAMAYTIRSGGKRLRPVVVLMIWELLGREINDEILPIACSIEMIHTYSLIHDDLPAMDNDDFRRGKPALHKKYDEGTAVLAGDGLFSYALEVFMQADISSDTMVKALKFFLREIGPEGIVAGQFVDTNINLFKRDESTLKFIHNKKTASLIAACFTLPVIVAEESEKIESFYRMGKGAGLLFQIIDDILDVTADPDNLGKSLNKDIKQNKLTYITFYELEDARKKAEMQYNNIMDLAEDAGVKNTLIGEMLTYFYKRIS
ncbi:MAG: polyprenyl synthetase family protein [candidate division WOR-3 bacterium]|nr:polyprenyl synthetase family protein [candidate division WOR-3 bacterium]